MLSEIKIQNYIAKPLIQDNIDFVYDFCNRYLGDNIYTREELLYISKLPHHFFYVVYDKALPIAIYYAYTSMIKGISEQYLLSALKDLPDDTVIGICKSIAVIEQYRDKGLSDILLKTFVDILHTKENAIQILTLAWIKDNYIPSESHLERQGFSKVSRINKPWSDIAGLECSVCNSTPCICDGMLYRYIFDDSKENK